MRIFEDIEEQVTKTSQKSFDLLKQAAFHVLDEKPLFDIEVSSACQMACVFCPRQSIERQQRLMSPETFQAIISFLPDNAVVMFAGMGEPLLNPHLANYVKALKERQISACMVTNGLLLTPQKQQELIEAGIDQFQISYHATDKTIATMLMPGYRTDVIENNLQHLSKNKPQSLRAQLNFVATDTNLSEQERVKEKAEQLGFSFYLRREHNRGGHQDKLKQENSISSSCGIFSAVTFITSDGNILSCANDLTGTSKFKHVSEASWSSVLKWKKKRLETPLTFPPCFQCNDDYRWIILDHLSVNKKPKNKGKPLLLDILENSNLPLLNELLIKNPTIIKFHKSLSYTVNDTPIKLSNSLVRFIEDDQVIYLVIETGDDSILGHGWWAKVKKSSYIFVLKNHQIERIYLENAIKIEPFDLEKEIDRATWEEKVRSEASSTKACLLDKTQPYKFGQVMTNNKFYFFRRMFSGEPLDQYFSKHSDLTLKNLLNIFIWTIEAVEYIHACEHIHRDVKLDNILFDPEKNLIRISDFGIAKPIDKQIDMADQRAWGTPLYIPPEMQNKLGSDISADTYYIGAMMGLVFGAKGGDNLQQDFDCTGLFKDFNLSPSTKEILSALISQMVQPDPKKRPILSSVRLALRELITTLPENELSIVYTELPNTMRYIHNIIKTLTHKKEIT